LKKKTSLHTVNALEMAQVQAFNSHFDQAIRMEHVAAGVSFDV
jgi:hypothetical protein